MGTEHVVTRARRWIGLHRTASVLLVMAVAVIMLGAYAIRNTFIGDAAVYLPYARNAGHGHPFQFNVGQFSSGSTSPLWSLLLGIPYLLGLGLDGARVFATAFAVFGFLAVVFAAGKLTRSWTAAAAAALFVLGTMTFYAVSFYESGLVVGLSALALVAGARLHRCWTQDAQVSVRAIGPLIGVWAALPLARPESALLVLAEAVALIVFSPVGRRRAAVTLLGALAVAAIPALLYFGYSQLELGTFSTSSRERAEALREGTHRRLGPLYLSGAAVRELLRSPWVFGVVPAVAGLWLSARRGGTRWLATYGVLAVAGYLALLTFVTPGFYDSPRYLLPIVPIVVVGAALALTRLLDTKARLVALVVAVLAIGGSGLLALRDNIHLARSIGITGTEVFERDVGAIINRLGRPGDTVLSYEVQMRYYLRKDVSVLSEDGITDAKVAPYQSRHDMTAFLRRYRPNWWIADDNVVTRRFMRGSVLNRAYISFRRELRPAVRSVDGIRFELVARRTRPVAPGFGGWKMLFRLEYPPARATSRS